MGNELQLSIGPYKFTATGIEKSRESTKDEWERYGYGLRAVDEAKQWAIGDWLADGKSHYGDGLYKKAAEVLDIPSNKLEQYAHIARTFKDLRQRKFSLTYTHHYETASLKLIAEDKKTKKLYLSDDTDYEKIAEFLSDAEKNSLSVRELRQAVATYKHQQKDHINLANAPDKYNVIYADPPWFYDAGDQHTDTEQETVLGTHYPSMKLSEICTLPVRQMAQDDAVLFMWVTSPLLEKGFEVVDAWGFEYKTSMVWDKVKHNVGNYVSVRHEILLICTRGSYTPENKKLYDSVYEEERSKHSRKPDWFRKFISEIYPNGKKIELFARTQHEGWDVWGNEV